MSNNCDKYITVTTTSYERYKLQHRFGSDRINTNNSSNIVGQCALRTLTLKKIKTMDVTTILETIGCPKKINLTESYNCITLG